MAKRSASRQITSDDFENEETNEDETGEFSKASNEELKKREYKKAKRTLPPNSSAIKTNPFAQLKLFNTTPLPAPTPNSFIQLVNVPNPLPKLTPPTQPSKHRKEGSNYLTKLKELNNSVSAWITQHVKKNPHIDLTPVFEDYQKYMIEIERENADKENEDDNNNSNSDNSSADEEERSNGEDMNEDVTPGAISVIPIKELPIQSTSTTNTVDDSLLNIRCKLFYKKENEYVELGLGNLCLTNGDKGGVCLLIRNDTAMKKVLLNVRLIQGVPLSLQKNKILLVCLPNPPLNVKSNEGDDNSDPVQSAAKPVTYLIKVKDESSAINLHTIITSNLE